MNIECPEDRPICDDATSTCRGCERDEECGAGFVCAGSGACDLPPAVCQSDEDCLGQPGRPICDLTTETCVGCTSDAQCTGLGQVCDAESHTCVVPPSCTSDAACRDPARPRCELGSGRCVACVEDADCNLAARQTCDRATGTCQDFVPCTSDSACAGDPAGERCDPESGLCVACLEDADCVPGSGRTCDQADKTCVGGTPCITDEQCVGLAAAVCDPRLGVCVECAGGTDCPEPGARCLLNERRCRAPQVCLSDADCGDPALPRCETSAGFCAECLVDEDCAGALAVCSGGVCDAGPPSGGRAGAPCRYTMDCEGASAHPPDQYDYYCLEPDDPVIPWKWYEGYCLGFCDGQADCPKGTVCLGGACWDSCQSDAECRAGYACQPLQAGGVVESICAPRCDPKLIEHLSCLADEDCPLGICDAATGRCACSPVGGPCVGLGSCRPDAGCIAETDATGQPTGWPGGYCIIVECDPPAVPCPAGSSCYRLPGDLNACLPDCDPNDLASCPRSAYACLEVDRPVLGGGCQSDAECGEATPTCFGAGAGALGACIRACQSDADCDASLGHICITLPGVTSLCADPFQGGACYPGCIDDLACGACASDADCRAGQLCSGGICRQSCTSDASCDAGEVCSGGFCAPACTVDGECARGSLCVGGACTPLRLRCDPVARRCDIPCDGDLACDRSRSCDLGTQSCYTACTSAGDDCGPAGRCDPSLGRCVVDCRAFSDFCPPETYCDADTGACLDRCGAFGSGSCQDPEICDLVNGECVLPCSTFLGASCLSSSECGAGEVCWLGTCSATCDRDSECGPGLLCQYGYACSPCPSSRWRCDAGGTELCVDCRDDTECGARFYCDVGGTWECVERCGGVGDGNRSCNPGEVCDVAAGGVCKVRCATDQECSDPARPLCDTSTGRCGACVSDAECAGDPAGPACDPLTLTCVACVDDQDCQDPTPACDASLPACVECTSDAHCAGHPSGARCDVGSSTCVQCLADADCPSATPTCDTRTFTCLPCTSDAECASGELCHTGVRGGECHPPCGALAQELSGEAIVDVNLSGFDDGAGGAASFVLFRGSNDTWAYTLDPASAGASSATVDLLAFGFSLPAGATLLGVAVSVEASTGGDPLPGSDQWQLAVEVLAPGGRVSAPQVAPTALSATDTVQVLGGPTDLWGLALTPADVADVSFGVRLSLTELGGSPDVRARVDQVLVTLHYETPGATICSSLDPSLSCNPVENRCQ